MYFFGKDFTWKCFVLLSRLLVFKGMYKFVHAVRTQWKIAENPKATEPYLSSSLCILTQYTRRSNEVETWQHHAYTGCIGCDHYVPLLAWWLVIHAGNKHIVANSLETGGSGCWDFFPFLVWSYSCSEICGWTVSLQVESLIKKENLENVHLEVQLWILKKISSIKFICIEAYHRSGRPLVQFVADGDSPRDTC